MTTQDYLASIRNRYQSGISSEHSYRGDLEALIRELVSEVAVTNEPSNVTDCGNPDYVITKDKIPIGYIEAKDVGKDLNAKVYQEQFGRYKKALDNLIITDYTWFQFFQNGELVHEIRIGELTENDIIPLPDHIAKFEALLKDFCTFVGQTITSPKKLAEMMAGKARLLQNILEQAIISDDKTEATSSLKGQYEAFKEVLIHDLNPRDFADIYAQTLAYGMFAARLHDESLETFSRQEAAEKIPKTNPFLRRLFAYVAGPDIDERIMRTVDNLAEVFRATNIKKLLQNFGKTTQTHDPIIHFYETFLAEYDPKLRKSRGVWYTPEPVVNFIVRAVDDILKTEFDLPTGLADTSKTIIKKKTDKPDKRTRSGYVELEEEVHKVQVLDPATGTGTFLAEVVKHIYDNNFKTMQGAWSGYVEEHLIPRLNGFELLMASYAMAHLKLDMLLRQTGYTSETSQRFHIYLTNSLEEHHPDTGTLFANWLSTEANEANHIKRDTPVMVVMGNPPYNGESQNKGQWIMDLMEDYKKEPGGKEKLKERNPKWINDDYVKFMRYAQYFIEKNAEGVLAFINPHGFLDNPTFRGMRWNLLKTYDKLYVIDLHGNAKKKETAQDGSKDENVFDIQQGVSINILVKTNKKKEGELGQVFHYDLYGLRELKYNYLWDNNLASLDFCKLPNNEPMHFMVQKDFAKEVEYSKYIDLNELFKVKNVGIVTSRDAFVISGDKDKLESSIKDFFELDKTELLSKYPLRENKSWKIDEVKIKAEQFDNKYIKEVSYRPFDKRFIYYCDDFIERSRNDVMQHFIKNSNVGLVTVARQPQASPTSYYYITDSIISNGYIRSDSVSIDNVFPLYLYLDDSNDQDLLDSQQRKPNLDSKIVQQIAKNLGLTFTSEKEQTPNTFAPIDILDYIYAVLHSPTYRETYKEFLKIDFPRVPFPDDIDKFWQLVELGGQIREIHLLESDVVGQYITTYPEDGDNVITRKMTKTNIGFELTDQENQTGKVWINDNQCFDNVPLIAWEFYIGGYQPAQKWLKDRYGRTLSFEDLQHYQKIIVALNETNRLMQEINKINI